MTSTTASTPVPCSRETSGAVAALLTIAGSALMVVVSGVAMALAAAAAVLIFAGPLLSG